MLGSAALDVAIGLIFVYLVASLIASAVNEVIENKLKNRSKDLERGIRELLGGDGDAVTDTVKKIYEHPLVSSLFKGTYETASKKGDLPSYIPARNFALALMHTVGGDEGIKGATTPGASADAGATLATLRAAADNFGNKHVGKALVALIDAAGPDVTRARQNIEDWFDSSMDRVSGWYKRRSQVFLVVIGIVLAGVGNVDSINIVNTLSKDSGKRDALVAEAREYASKQTTPAAISGADDPVLQNLDKIGLPVGWSGTRATDQPYDPRSFPVNPVTWIIKLLGIALTAAAISLGSPFWFDTLNKFVVVRSTVKPTEKSPPEKPKD